MGFGNTLKKIWWEGHNFHSDILFDLCIYINALLLKMFSNVRTYVGLLERA